MKGILGSLVIVMIFGLACRASSSNSGDEKPGLSQDNKDGELISPTEKGNAGAEAEEKREKKDSSSGNDQPQKKKDGGTDKKRKCNII